VSWLHLRRWPGAAAALALLLLAASVVALAAPTAPARPLAASARRWLNHALAAAHRHQFDAAYEYARRAASAAPHRSELAAVAAYLRQRAVLEHLRLAHADQLAFHHNRAALEYRSALALDPANADARQGLLASYPAAVPPPAPGALALRVRYAAPPIQIQPAPGRRSFHVRAGLRAVVAQVAAAYGLRAYVANQVPHRALRLDLGRANFAEAMAALRAIAGIDWIPLNAHTLYFAQTAQLRTRQPLALRSFYLPWVASGAQLTQLANLTRALLGIQEITVHQAGQSLSLRATPEQLDAAERLLLDLRGSPGQVLLQIKILELNASAARQLGLGLPDQFTMFALGPLLAELSQNSSVSQNILQLFNQGGLNAILNSGALGSLLSQLPSSISPLLQNPFVIFGGGATLMALSVPQFTANLSAADNRSTTVETALLRAQGGQSAELKIGEKYPIINASFSPISLSPAIEKVIGSGSYLQPFPSFTYEDLGLDAKITPEIAPSGSVQLRLDITVNGLSGESSDNIPILNNRHLQTEIGLQDNEPVLIAGLLDRQETLSLAGLPGLSQIPGLGPLFDTSNRQSSNDELAILVTPHIVQLPSRAAPATWLPASLAPGTGAPAFVQPVPSRFPGRALPGRFPFTFPGRGGRGPVPPPPQPSIPHP
jgi:general secretion pathway protein D